MKRPGAIALIPVMLSILLGACNIGSNPDTRLGVPYRAQDPNSFDCGPASVLMWRLYDGYPEISQQTIGNYMGGTSCGVSANQIAQAVNYFTGTHDAYVDLAGDVEYREFLSRQVTSIDSRVPVIALIHGGLHAGVVNGGKWHDNTSGDHQWDYVYFHDPLTVANDYYSGDAWQDTNCPPGGACQQVASYNASGAWSYNLNTYGDDVVMGGGGGGDGHGPYDY
jgi:hypothetical protein